MPKKVLKEKWITKSELKVYSDVLSEEKRVASDMNRSEMCKENFNSSEISSRSEKNTTITVNQRSLLTPIQLTTPCKLSEDISLSSTENTVRRSSRSKKSRRLSKLHLVPVRYSSDGSEGSLSDLEDIMPKPIFLKEAGNHEGVLSNEGLLEADTLSADDELSVYDGDSTRETAKIKKKVKKKSDKIKKSPRRLLMLKQTEKKINQLSYQYQSEDKLVYHGRNFVPKNRKDEMEMECDFSWVKIQNKNRILEFTDVNAAEKVLMSLWNEHVRKHHGIGFINLDKVLKEFVLDNFSVISEQEIYRNFVCHVVSYHEAGLISQSSVIGCFIHLQKLLVKDSLPAMQVNNIRNITKDSITILNNTFTNLSLKSGKEKRMTDGVDSLKSDHFSVTSETLALSEKSEVLDEESNGSTSFSAVEVTELMEKCMI